MATNSEHCPLCESFAAPSMKGVVRHIGLVHSHEFGFRVTCGVGGCTRSYTKFSSYKKHMYVKHRDTLGVSTRQRSPDMTASSLVLSAFQEDEEEEEQPYCAERDRSTALFILKACEIHKIPQSSLNHLLSDISTYIDMTKTRLMYNVGITLRQKGITMEDELRAICNSPDVTDPFNSLHSQYLQTQYFIKHFNLVVSMLGSLTAQFSEMYFGHIYILLCCFPFLLCLPYLSISVFSPNILCLKCT